MLRKTIRDRQTADEENENPGDRQGKFRQRDFPGQSNCFYDY